MMRRILLVGLLSLFAVPVHAQDVYQTISPAQMKAHLLEWGFVVFAHEDEFDRPQLLVSPDDMDEKRFGIRFLQCEPGADSFMDSTCKSFEFQAYIKPGFPITAKTYNKWNAQAGAARAFHDDEATYLTWHVHVGGGYAWPNVRAQLDLWRAALGEFVIYLDESILDMD